MTPITSLNIRETGGNFEKLPDWIPSQEVSHKHCSQLDGNVPVKFEKSNSNNVAVAREGERKKQLKIVGTVE